MDSKNLLLAAALSGLALTLQANDTAKTKAPTAEAQAVEGQCLELIHAKELRHVIVKKIAVPVQIAAKERAG